MITYKCPYCNNIYSAQGIRGHIRLVEKKPVPKDISHLAVTEQTSTSSVPQTSDSLRLLEETRAKLEIRRLEKEIDKLDNAKPDTNIDYYGKLIEMQNQFHNERMLQQQKYFEKQLELERLRLKGGSDDDGLLLELLPFVLPLIKSKFGNQNVEFVPSAPVNLSTQKEKEAEMDNEIENFINQIKEGKITENNAWLTFQKYKERLPVIYQNLTRQQFKEEFKKIRENKK